MYIDYLANHKTLVPDVAQVLYGDLGNLSIAGSISKVALEQELLARAVTNQVPLTLVAVNRGGLAGTGSIDLKVETNAEVSPWLSGIYVTPLYRGAGLGALLLDALERKASKLGVSTLYLSTRIAENFLIGRGWSVIEWKHGHGSEDATVMSKYLGPAPNSLTDSMPGRVSAPLDV